MHVLAVAGGRVAPLLGLPPLPRDVDLRERPSGEPRDDQRHRLPTSPHPRHEQQPARCARTTRCPCDTAAMHVRGADASDCSTLSNTMALRQGSRCNLRSKRINTYSPWAQGHPTNHIVCEPCARGHSTRHRCAPMRGQAYDEGLPPSCCVSGPLGTESNDVTEHVFLTWAEPLRVGGSETSLSPLRYKL